MTLTSVDLNTIGKFRMQTAETTSVFLVASCILSLSRAVSNLHTLGSERKITKFPPS